MVTVRPARVTILEAVTVARVTTMVIVEVVAQVDTIEAGSAA